MDFWTIQVPVPLVLAVVATLGYLFGRRCKKGGDEVMLRSQRELRRAQAVADELEKIALGVRKNLAKHCMSVNKFKGRVSKLGDRQKTEAWMELCAEAEAILKPTLQLASQIANAYDEIRQQSANLMSFTEIRTDPLTGVRNRRGLDDAMSDQLAMMTRYSTIFSLAIFDIDHFKNVNDAEGHLYGDRVLQDLAQLIDECAREPDIVARYGGDEFIVVMPQTDLKGAAIFCERLRRDIERKLPLTISGGVTAVLEGDTHDTLIARADNALYCAKSGGRNRVFHDDGQQTEPITEETPTPDSQNPLPLTVLPADNPVAVPDDVAP